MQEFHNSSVGTAVGRDNINLILADPALLGLLESEPLALLWHADKAKIRELHRARLIGPEFFATICSLALFCGSIWGIGALDRISSFVFLMIAGTTCIISAWFYGPLCQRNMRWIKQYRAEMEQIEFILHKRGADLLPGERPHSYTPHCIILAIFILLVIPFMAMAAPPAITPAFSDIDIAYTKKGKLVMQGKTTLPDGTKISSLILQIVPRKGLYMDTPMNEEEWDVVVQNGAFTSWFPDVYEKGLAGGKYIIQIGVLPNQQDLLGPQNAWLTGPDVTTDRNGHKSFVWESTMVVPDLPGHKKERPPTTKW